MRALLEDQQCVTCASVFDPLSSRMADDIGFKVGILGGSVASLMTLGAPDIYLLTLNELVQQAKRVCSASDLPVIVDGDNGYGNSLNVMRAVTDLEYAGASMITLEDTILPRPHGESELCLYEIEEAQAKLRAALKARTDPEFAIFARTHALPSQSLDSLLERVRAYSAVGVDGICIFGLSEKDKLALLSEVTDLPTMLINYGDVDLGAKDELVRQNVRIRFAGHEAYEQSVKAVYESLMQLHLGGVEAEPMRSAKEVVRRYSKSNEYNALASEYVFSG